MFPARQRPWRVALAVIIGLIVLQAAAASVTGSIGILAQTADSILDLFAAGFVLFLARAASRPADAEHPFGHGKLENVAASVQAILIFAGALVVGYFAVQRLTRGGEPRFAWVGIAVTLFSLLVDIILSRRLIKLASKTGSLELEAAARHIAGGIYSAAAVLAALLAGQFNAWKFLDPIAAIAISLFIVKIGIDVIRRASPALIDTKLPEEEERIIRSTIMDHCVQLIGFHELRTRMAGDQRYIDLHLVVPRSASVAEAHAIADHLEQDIRTKLRHASIIMHIEPCSDECGDCKVPCNLRDKSGLL